MTPKKKLIEVALPLQVVNKGAWTKSIQDRRRGALHLCWPQRLSQHESVFEVVELNYSVPALKGRGQLNCHDI